MSRGERSDKIPRLVLAGIEQAFKTYNKWTLGDSWLWEAPEYLITVEVAKQLFDKLTYRYINLEFSVKDALEDAGAIRRGRPKKALRRNGRFDILLSHSSGNPWCAIEIKSRIWSPKTHLSADIVRLRDTVLRRHRGSTLRCAALGFYSERAKPQRKHNSAKDSLDSLADSTDKLARQLLKGSNLTCKIHKKFKSGDHDDGRQAYCLFIEARKPNAASAKISKK